MRKSLTNWLLALICLFLPILSIAATTWQIEPDKSSLKFTATQNNAPVSGQFKSFTGEINFDPNQLKSSQIKILIDMNSISDPYNQLSDTLKGKDWFDSKDFPQGIYKSNEIISTGNKTYQAKGMLTLRDKTLPVVINFNQEEYSPTHALMKGSTTIKRTAFGVGQGQWSDTNAIKDEVKIDFIVSAINTQKK